MRRGSGPRALGRSEYYLSAYTVAVFLDALVDLKVLEHTLVLFFLGSSGSGSDTAEKDALEAWLKKRQGHRELASPPVTRARTDSARTQCMV